MTILILSGVKAGMQVNKEWIPVSLLNKTVSKLTNTLPDQVIPNILAFLNMEKSTTPELGQYQVFINPVSGNKKVHFPITVRFVPFNLHDTEYYDTVINNKINLMKSIDSNSRRTAFEDTCSLIVFYLFHGAFDKTYEVEELIRNCFQQVSDQDKYTYPSREPRRRLPLRFNFYDTSHDYHYSIFQPKISGRYAEVLYRINLIDPQDPRPFMDTEPAKIKSKEIIDSPKISVRKLICVIERIASDEEIRTGQSDEMEKLREAGFG
jgi:hypothetical protein